MQTFSAPPTTVFANSPRATGVTRWWKCMFASAARRNRRRLLGLSPHCALESLESRALLSSTPIAQWHFEETSGATALDSTATGANGTNTGAVTGIGAIGNGYLFNGVDSKVEFGTKASIGGLSSFTVTAWFRTTSETGQAIVQQRDNDGFNGQYVLQIFPDGTLSFVLFGDGANQFVIGSQQSVNDGAWHHVAAGREGKRGFIYLDGKLAAETYGTPRSLNPNISVGVGADIRDGYSFFNGSIDEVAIYDSVIPASEIATSANIIVPQGTSRNPRPVFTWPVIENAASYSLWVEKIGASNNPVINETLTVNDYAAPIDLGLGQYRTWVRAALNDGSRTPWKAQTFSIDGQVDLNPIAANQLTARPELQWQPFPGVVKYDLWIDDTANHVTQYIRNQNITGTSWTPATDMPLGSYQAWIRGVAADGATTNWSQVSSFNVVPPPNLTAGQNSTFDRTPTFAWNSLPGASKYDLVVRNQTTKINVIDQRNMSGLNFTPTTSLPDGQYNVWIRGVSAANVRSSWTNGISIHVGGRTDVLTPVGTITNTVPTFTWKPVDGTVRYDLWVDQVGVTSQIIRRTNETGTSYTATAPLPAGAYRVWVRAISATESSPWSLIVNFSIA